MIVQALSNAKIDKKITFGQKNNQDKIYSTYPHQKASGLKTVPVVVLMAMNPSLLNADQIRYFEPEQVVPEVVVPMSKNVPQNVSNPEGYIGTVINNRTIQHKEDVYIEGKKYTMIYVDEGKSVRENKNVVNRIYLVPREYKPDINPMTHTAKNSPPEVRAFVYHAIGEDHFCSVKLVELPSYDTNKKAKKMELRLPNEVANKIFALISGADERFGRTKNIENLFVRVDNADMDPVVEN